METIQIRIANMNDAPGITDLSDQLGYPTSVRQSERRLKATIGSRDHAVFVACSGRNVVGWLHVFISLRIEVDPFAEIGGFVVAESHRRAGIGRRLLASAEEWAVGRSVERLRVRSRSERDDARAFYENMGFSIIKKQRVFDKPLK